MGIREKRRGRPIKFLVWIAIILLVLVSSSAIVLAKMHDATIGHVSLTPQGGTATHAAKTPTVNGTPGMTTTASSVATPTQLFFEDFSNNSKQWATTRLSGLIRDVDTQHGLLVLSATDRRIVTESLPSSTSFNNFTMLVDFSLQEATKSDSVGLYVRGDTNLDHDYRIDIYGNNTVTISKEYLDQNEQPQSTELVRKTGVSSIRPQGQLNTLTLEANGPTLSIKINAVPVISSLYDADYTSGQIALFVNNSGHSINDVTANFANIEITSIPDPLPTPTPTSTMTATPTTPSSPTVSPAVTP